MDNILSIKGLTVRFYTYDGVVKAVEDVRFDIGKKETFLGLVSQKQVIIFTLAVIFICFAGATFLDAQDVVGSKATGDRPSTFIGWIKTSGSFGYFIILCFVICGLVLTTLASVYEFGRIASLSNILLVKERLNVEVLSLRKHEKDFFARK